jgi:hypothetical protein
MLLNKGNQEILDEALERIGNLGNEQRVEVDKMMIDKLEQLQLTSVNHE